MVWSLPSRCDDAVAQIDRMMPVGNGIDELLLRRAIELCSHGSFFVAGDACDCRGPHLRSRLSPRKAGALEPCDRTGFMVACRADPAHGRRPEWIFRNRVATVN